jgi:hypothetical protein
MLPNKIDFQFVFREGKIIGIKLAVEIGVKNPPLDVLKP